MSRKRLRTRRIAFETTKIRIGTSPPAAAAKHPRTLSQGYFRREKAAGGGARSGDQNERRACTHVLIWIAALQRRPKATTSTNARTINTVRTRAYNAYSYKHSHTRGQVYTRLRVHIHIYICVCTYVAAAAATATTSTGFRGAVADTTTRRAQR